MDSRGWIEQFMDQDRLDDWKNSSSRRMKQYQRPNKMQLNLRFTVTVERTTNSDICLPLNDASIRKRMKQTIRPIHAGHFNRVVD